MRVFVFAGIVALALLCNASEFDNYHSNLDASMVLVGVHHTDAFARLADAYSQRRPRDRNELARDVSDVVGPLCDQENAEERQRESCLDLVQRAVANAFASTPSLVVASPPDDAHPSVREHFAELGDLLERSSSSVDELEESLRDLRDRVARRKGNKDDDEDRRSRSYRTALLGGLAVALESPRMWRDVYADVDHPLHGLHYGDGSFFVRDNEEEEEEEERSRRGRRRRFLQGNPYEGLTPVAVARADVSAALSTFIDQFIEMLVEADVVLAAGLIVPVTAAGAIAASAAHIESYVRPATETPSELPTSTPTVSKSPSFTAAPTPHHAQHHANSEVHHHHNEHGVHVDDHHHNHGGGHHHPH